VDILYERVVKQVTPDEVKLVFVIAIVGFRDFAYFSPEKQTFPSC
jgi:hypothetical protein